MIHCMHFNNVVTVFQMYEPWKKKLKFELDFTFVTWSVVSPLFGTLPFIGCNTFHRTTYTLFKFSRLISLNLTNSDIGLYKFSKPNSMRVCNTDKITNILAWEGVGDEIRLTNDKYGSRLWYSQFQSWKDTLYTLVSNIMHHVNGSCNTQNSQRGVPAEPFSRMFKKTTNLNNRIKRY